MVLDQQEKQTPFEGHYAFSVLNDVDKKAWVVDSGASTHICSIPDLFVSTYRLDRPVKVHLLDGSSKMV